MKNTPISLLLATRLFPPAFTGAGLRFLRYEPGLRARGINMTVFTCATTAPTKHGWEQNSGGETSLEFINDIPVWRVHLASRKTLQKDLEFASAILSYYERTTSHPDILHLVSPSPFFLAKYRPLRRLKVPIIASYTLLSELSSSGWKRLLQRLLLIFSYQVADCIVTGTGFSREVLVERGIRKPIIVIPNGVDIERFKPPPTPEAKFSLRKQLGFDLNSNDKIVLFVGSLTHRKGIDILLKAWEIIATKHTNSHLVLAGPMAKEVGQERLLSEKQIEIDRRILEVKKRGRVALVGQVANIEDYYRAADILVFPSLREGMPNVLLEAFSCGLPAVVTPFLGISPEFGQPGKQFILAERSPDGLAHATLELLDAPLRCQEIGHRGRKWVEEHLSLETSLDRYSALYREWVGKYQRLWH